MEINVGRSCSNGNRAVKHHSSIKESNDRAKKDKVSSVFVNSAALAWHENRRKWIGDKSQQPPKIAKDPIISWSTAYEDLLSTNEPFQEPIPLPEMVDFLVDIWHDEGLFDWIATSFEESQVKI